MLERDAELGIDRETTDLVTMLEEKGILQHLFLEEECTKIVNVDEGSSSFFKFKEEQLFETNQKDMVSG